MDARASSAGLPPTVSTSAPMVKVSPFASAGASDTRTLMISDPTRRAVPKATVSAVARDRMTVTAVPAPAPPILYVAATPKTSKMASSATAKASDMVARPSAGS